MKRKAWTVVRRTYIGGRGVNFGGVGENRSMRDCSRVQNVRNETRGDRVRVSAHEKEVQRVRESGEMRRLNGRSGR